MKKEKFQESLEVQQERIIFKFGVRISCKTSRGIYQFFFFVVHAIEDELSNQNKYFSSLITYVSDHNWFILLDRSILLYRIFTLLARSKNLVESSPNNSYQSLSPFRKKNIYFEIHNFNFILYYILWKRSLL